MVSVDVKRNVELDQILSRSEPRSCVKVEVAVLGSPALIVLTGLCGRKATLKLEHHIVGSRTLLSVIRFCRVLEIATCDMSSDF